MVADSRAPVSRCPSPPVGGITRMRPPIGWRARMRPT